MKYLVEEIEATDEKVDMKERKTLKGFMDTFKNGPDRFV